MPNFKTRIIAALMACVLIEGAAHSSGHLSSLAAGNLARRTPLEFQYQAISARLAVSFADFYVTPVIFQKVSAVRSLVDTALPDLFPLYGKSLAHAVARLLDDTGQQPIQLGGADETSADETRYDGPFASRLRESLRLYNSDPRSLTVGKSLSIRQFRIIPVTEAIRQSPLPWHALVYIDHEQNIVIHEAFLHWLDSYTGSPERFVRYLTEVLGHENVERKIKGKRGTHREAQTLFPMTVELEHALLSSYASRWSEHGYREPFAGGERESPDAYRALVTLAVSGFIDFPLHHYLAQAHHPAHVDPVTEPTARAELQILVQQGLLLRQQDRYKWVPWIEKALTAKVIEPFMHLLLLAGDPSAEGHPQKVLESQLTALRSLIERSIPATTFVTSPPLSTYIQVVRRLWSIRRLFHPYVEGSSDRNYAMSLFGDLLLHRPSTERTLAVMLKTVAAAKKGLPLARDDLAFILDSVGIAEEDPIDPWMLLEDAALQRFVRFVVRYRIPRRYIPDAYLTFVEHSKEESVRDQELFESYSQRSPFGRRKDNGPYIREAFLPDAETELIELPMRPGDLFRMYIDDTDRLFYELMDPVRLEQLRQVDLLPPGNPFVFMTQIHDEEQRLVISEHQPIVHGGPSLLQSHRDVSQFLESLPGLCLQTLELRIEHIMAELRRANEPSVGERIRHILFPSTSYQLGRWERHPTHTAIRYFTTVPEQAGYRLTTDVRAALDSWIENRGTFNWQKKVKRFQVLSSRHA